MGIESPGLLSIIVPVYNECATVRAVLDTLRTLPGPPEIIVVDDGSTDGTAGILADAAGTDIRVVTHAKNQGKGGAVRTGLAHASGEVAAIHDADHEYNPRELIALAAHIFAGRYDIVFGSRFLCSNPVRYARYYLGNRLMSGIISCLALRRITDAYTCYKVFRTALVRGFCLTSSGFEIEAELSMKSALSTARFRELPISYAPRTIQEGKKIRWMDMLRGIGVACATRFSFHADMRGSG